jgi:anti-anti-sigma regulatory factor
MSLKIKQYKDTFIIRGCINANTTKQLRRHLEFLIRYTKKLTLDIGAVTQIDANGMKVLRELYAFALQEKKSLCFVGYGCKALHEDFEAL